jgi:flagellar biosynthetic protein FliP
VAATILAAPVFSAAQAAAEPSISIGPDTDATSTPIKIIVLLTLLSFIPAVLMTMTCFTRLIVVFHFLRQAIGTQETPNNQILIGLSFFLTMFVMSPVMTEINKEALQPMLANEIGHTEALERAVAPLRGFMLKHTRERDLALFVRLSGGPKPQTADDVPTFTLVPAFIISELKTAFQIGFVLFIPFLVIDMACSSILLSMGMMQLPPVIVSTPLKLLLFVMVDGWYLIISSLVKDLV